jgi:hypothetical protein
MAYSTSNPPRLIAQGIAAGREWLYQSSDPSTTVDDTDYFSNGYNLGMRVGDKLTSVVSSSYNTSIGAVSVASSSGPCTVIFGNLVST